MDGTIVMDTRVLERIAHLLENVSQAMSDIKLPSFGNGLIVCDLREAGVPPSHSQKLNSMGFLTGLQRARIADQAERTGQLAIQCRKAAILMDNCEKRLQGIFEPSDPDLSDILKQMIGFLDHFLDETADEGQINDSWVEDTEKGIISIIEKLFTDSLKDTTIGPLVTLLSPFLFYTGTGLAFKDYDINKAKGKLLEGFIKAVSKVTGVDKILKPVMETVLNKLPNGWQWLTDIKAAPAILSGGIITFVSTTAGALTTQWAEYVSGEKGADEAIFNAVGQGVVKAGATVAIGVGIAALGAPAAVVTLAAGVTYIVIDTGVKIFTDKSLTEWGGDGMELLYKHAKQGVKVMIESTGDCVQTVADTIGKGAEAVWNFFNRGLAFI